MNLDLVSAHLKSTGSVYVSVTGLRIKNFWKILYFIRFAVPSMMQAQKSKGLLFVDAKKVSGVQHTLSVWESRKHMLAFTHSGIHKRAIENFRSIATGSTLGYEASAMPTWDDAIAKWKSDGRTY